ncbi:hypothetical protein CcaverHIS002_0304940 [Cutaneotrichosporon cavernicola]|uniref:WSC domain-containing protein n=1 Tax=Cutaneotrichosporon cavernicola TaxID=279322 RepID=A0AA48IB48_9TREE|nr:uncharacterized protein CcaverHIS019_0304900 [Cutaneotrichosporon cavernicola]BEI82626.1 hypothetical protein CcaverHIS002_0304940 [Cutaneotrichosporon cavernicola]BEI90420.1 hypothetical protein CcaverHIS019_0304900 [Cutaneotrichosporon cavernicola]BEI98195.1 hypothetical protein CcaverHIS631_0304940 [Cutaneotrichosporon cavernicola]BEJ05971.1 hypothetical protein CcaverHIS641_0304930 [Cutaneotrichosporon cavernicola]
MALAALFISASISVSGALAAPAPAAQPQPALRERYYGDIFGLSPPPPLLERRAVLPAGWNYDGCVTESNGVRLLQGFGFSSPSNSPSFCIAECARRGFSIAGTEYGGECYCANALTGDGGRKAPDDVCSMACQGEPGTKCGAAWYLSLYKLNPSTGGSGGGQVPSNCPTTSSPSSTTKATTTTTATTATTKSTTASNPTATGVVVPVPPNVPAATEQPLVWAHHMVGNTYSYANSDWQADINAAASQAIDGFALNIGIEGWQTDQAAVAYRVAEARGSFKMFLSLDMTSLPCGSAADANRLVNLVRQLASSPAQAMYRGKVLVSTFAGSDCTFGTGTNAGWQTMFVDPLVRAGVKIFFIPSVFMNPADFSKLTWMDGELNWNSAWPVGNKEIDTATDVAYRAGLGGKTYMTAVSPFFFTHFGVNSWNKNWIYRSDNWLYCTRWEQIIAQRGVSTMTEILTWNDYGESSYIGPIRGSLPATSERWVNGFDHSALAPITKYYATAYKTGSYPRVDKDQIILWARPHAARAQAPDPVGRPTGYDWTDDNLYAVVFATAPSVATLTSGGNSMSFSVPAGLSKIKMPLAPGTIGGTIERGGQRVVTFSAGAQYSFTTTPTAYNYNYWVGSS